MRAACKGAASHVIRWLCGGLLYGGLEILWRGHTHWTMIVLAAFLCIPLDILNEHLPWNMPLLKQSVLGGTIITGAEFVAGCVLNLWLGLGVWNYANQPFNLLGQVCLLYWVLWCLLAGPVIVVFDWLEYRLCGGEKPHYKLV